MKKPDEMKTFDIDPLFEILDYAEELENLSKELVTVSMSEDFLRMPLETQATILKIESLLKSRGVVK